MADEQVAQAQGREDGERVARHALLEQAADRLTAAQGARALLEFDDDRQAGEARLKEAGQARQQACGEADKRRSHLRSRERELRTCERLLERVVHELTSRENRLEQILVDDIVSFREADHD